MKPVKDVTVKSPIYNVHFYCQFRQRKRGEPVWRCGRCVRGIITPKLGSKCKVCKAIVSGVKR